MRPFDQDIKAGGGREEVPRMSKSYLNQLSHEFNKVSSELFKVREFL